MTVRNVWGINSLPSYFDLVFVPVCWISRRKSSGYTFLTKCHADVWRVLAHFCSEHSARPSTGRSGQIIDSVCMSQFPWCAWPISCSRSTVGVAVHSRHRLVACCALVRNSLQTSCLQWDSLQLSHSRHNAEARSMKVGYEISRPTRNLWFVNIFSTFRCQNSVIKMAVVCHPPGGGAGLPYTVQPAHD